MTPGRLWCWRVTSYCARCRATVGQLCRKLSPVGPQKSQLLPPSKSSNARQFRMLTPQPLRRPDGLYREGQEIRPEYAALLREQVLEFEDRKREARANGTMVYEDDGSLFTTDAP